MDTIPIIEKLNKVEARIARTQQTLSTLKDQREKLAIALEVIEELAGTDQTKSDEKSSKAKLKRTKKPDGLPTMREMVKEALMDANARGLDGLPPRGIREYVLKRFKFNMGSSANTVPSHMWNKAKEIEKNEETGLFSLPKEIEAPDADREIRSSGASCSFQPAQGGEACPGGGA